MGRGERERAIFGLPTPSDPKWVFSLGPLLEAHFFLKFAMHDPYMGLGLMIGGLLEIVLGIALMPFWQAFPLSSPWYELVWPFDLVTHLVSLILIEDQMFGTKPPQLLK